MSDSVNEECKSNRNITSSYSEFEAVTKVHFWTERFCQASALGSCDLTSGTLPNRCAQRPVQEEKGSCMQCKTQTQHACMVETQVMTANTTSLPGAAPHAALPAYVPGCGDSTLVRAALQPRLVLPHRCSAPSIHWMDCDPRYRTDSNIGC